MGLTLVTPATVWPVSLAEARVQVGLHAADTSCDDQLNGYIEAATDRLDGPDGELGFALMPQTWDYTVDAFTGTIELPLGPVVSVDTVKYFDQNGAEQTASDDFYTTDLSSDRPWIVLNTGLSWPTTLDAVNAVTIRFTAGRGCPASVKQAILLQIDHWFQPIGPNNQVDHFERSFAALTGTKRRMFL